MQTSSKQNIVDIFSISGDNQINTPSDARLKENVELLDTVDGYPIYAFDYIKGAKNQVGVIAQDMLERQPDCVGIGDDGYYFVDYAKLPKNVRLKIKSYVDADD